MKNPKLRFKGFAELLKPVILKEIINVKTGLTPLRSRNEFFTKNKGIQWVKTLDLNDSFIQKTEEHVTEIALKETSLSIIPKGTVLIAMYGGFNQIGRTGVTMNEATTNQAISALIPKKDTYIDSIYLQNYLKSYKSYWRKIAASSRKDPNITKKDIENLVLYLPSKQEQIKVASFLSLMQQKIELQKERINLLKEQKNGFIQKIFNQEIYLKDSKWSEVRFSDVLISKDIRQVPSDEVPLMAFTSTGGVEPKGERYNREFLVKNENKTYKRTDYNDLIYSSNNLDVGAIGRNKLGTAVISDVYEIFEVREGYKAEFIEILIQQNSFLNKILKFRQGALYGQYRIHASDFLSVSVLLPTLEEQVHLSNFVMKIDLRLDLETDKLAMLIQQKKAFMQQIFI